MTREIIHANKQYISINKSQVQETLSPIKINKQIQSISIDGGQLPHQQHSEAVTSCHVDSSSWAAVEWPGKVQ